MPNPRTISGGVNSARGDIGAYNLRNLGTGNTLVLLNGRRLVNAASYQTEEVGGSFIPVNTVNSQSLPVSGLERVEVLRDGASAIYGADAVAGVVNYVMKSDFDSGRVRVTRPLRLGSGESAPGLFQGGSARTEGSSFSEASPAEGLRANLAMSALAASSRVGRQAATISGLRRERGEHRGGLVGALLALGDGAGEPGDGGVGGAREVGEGDLADRLLLRAARRRPPPRPGSR